ncbi:MAG: UDP-N-acetylmuramate dehydrogenase [Actinobacteria bacterium]|nr:UDP-N-acetylmuramate dehydrogenase [Actinomycetota bacterium]
MQVGGVPASIQVCNTREQLIEIAKTLWASGDDWITIGGGTNLVFSQDVSNLNVIQVKTTGIEKTVLDGKQVWKIQAGVDWDELVKQTVDAGLAGIEGMSGIPGSCGASPVQNIGAYGQELSDVFLRAEFLDYESGDLVILEPKDLKFGYRDSAIKRGRTGIITWIEIELLDLEGLSRPLYSGQIAGALKSEMGKQVKLTDVRESVLALRAAKGMVLDAKDPNSVSCGSFFTNPIVSDSFARTLSSDAPRWETQEDDGLTVKLSAAWLIEQAGIGKEFSLPGSKAAISSKHALAIVNTGGATGEEIAELARFIQERVAAAFGINLVPEPNLIGFAN